MPVFRNYNTSGQTVNILGQYRVNAMTLADNETIPVQMDINGNLKVVVVSGGGGGGTTTVDLPNRGAITPTGGTITTANTSQQILTANANRKYLLIQNQSSEILWINFGATATQSQPSIQIPANGGFYESNSVFCSNQAINIIGATIGSSFSILSGQ